MASPAKIPVKRPGKAGGKRDENRRSRATALSSAGLALFLERGIEDVTIDEIAERAGTAKGNFYRYFDDKAQLVDALMQPVARACRVAMRKCGVDLAKARTPAEVYEAYGALAASIGNVTATHRDEVRLFLQENRAPRTPARVSLRALADELSRGAILLSQAARDHGVIEVADPQISALAVVGAIEHLTLAILRDDLKRSGVEIASTLIRMVLDGVRKR